MIIVYCCEPIDNWVGWTDEVRFLARIVPPEDDWIRDEYVAFSSRAYELARLVWWEGDMREGPYISALPFPDRNGSRPLLAWKQDNNGTTFIASPVHLPWVTEKIWVVESDAGVVTLSPELIAMEDARKKRLKGEPEWSP